jgi:hypothetical protein
MAGFFMCFGDESPALEAGVITPFDALRHNADPSASIPGLATIG